jgi:IPT/TIG domain
MSRGGVRVPRLGPGLLACASLIGAAGSFVAPAGAAIVTVGPVLGSATVEGHAECGSPSGCLVAQKTPSYTSPVTGKIVGWRVKGATGTFSLQVLRGNTGGATSALGTAAAGKTFFPAEIPIEAGDRFGVDIPQVGDELGYEKLSGATFSAWSPGLGLGETRAPTEDKSKAELLVNVDIQPVPGISAVAPTSGPMETDPVTITGHDFEAVEDVSFGAYSASFEVLSETTLVAQAFAIAPSTVPVTITTRAGTVSLPAAFTFEEAAGPAVTIPNASPLVIPDLPPVIPDLSSPDAVECHVPRLKGKTLKQAKPALAAAHCKLGRVTRRKGLKHRPTRIVSELPPAGSRAPASTSVRVRLGA